MRAIERGEIVMVKQHLLNNGVRIVEEHVEHVNSVSMGIWILSGSRNENEKLEGISHLIEHMFFKGTKTKTAKQIAESFDMIGGETNAFTSKEYTCIYARVMDQHAIYAFDILSDMFFHSNFDEVELEREKKVVLEEILMTEDTPDDIIFDYLHQTSFENHPLKTPILGTEGSLKEITRDDILKYIDQFYTPDRIVISIAGNIQEGLIEHIKNTFSQLKSKHSTEDELFAFFNQDEVKKIKETQQAHLTLAYRGLPIGHEDMYPLLVFNNVLGGSMSSRLFQTIREELGLTYSIFSFHNAFRDNGLLTIYGATSPHQIENMHEAIIKIVKDIKEHGISDKELNNSIQQIKGQLVLGLENPNSRMHRNGRNELLNQPHNSLQDLIRKIESVNHSSIKEVSHHILNSDPAKALILPEGV